jgi:hypothetical protein
MKKLVLSAALFISIGAQASAPVESYKISIIRNGKSMTEVAYNFWSGEWPGPVADVNSSQAGGKTTLKAYSSLRNPVKANEVNCTIKNGIYHPWATPEQDPSIITYYSLVTPVDFKVVKATEYTPDDGGAKMTIPAGATITNVVYYAENGCGALINIGKKQIQAGADCPFFLENKNFKRVSPTLDFQEQWLYMTCEEKGVDGKNVKAFIRDQALLATPGVVEGCPTSYGSVGDSKSCANQ